MVKIFIKNNVNSQTFERHCIFLFLLPLIRKQTIWNTQYKNNLTFIKSSQKIIKNQLHA